MIIRNVITNNIETRYKIPFVSISILSFVVLSCLMLFSVRNYIYNSLSYSIANEKFDDSSQNIVEVVVSDGDTLSKILYNQNISNAEVGQILSSLKSLTKPFGLRKGQKIKLEFEADFVNADQDLMDEYRVLKSIYINLSKTNFITIDKKDNGFVAHFHEIPLKMYLSKKIATINSNFISTIRSLGINNNNISDLVKSYSHQVDFQRNIKSGDKIEILVEKYVTEEGEFSHNGKILFASLSASGKKFNIYNYEYKNTKEYFSEDGKSIKQNLLRTPINVVKISSGYGNRLHPVLGYNKMHKGVDFLAPKGTPIYAAGNGIITELGWKNGFGNYVQIKHSGTLSTAYAHATGFAKGLHLGSKVKQGQVIAYVGQTGRATGPHLHYEVKINGKHVNPMSIKTSAGISLNKKEMQAFAVFKNKIHKMHSTIGDQDLLMN